MESEKCNFKFNKYEKARFLALVCCGGGGGGESDHQESLVRVLSVLHSEGDAGGEHSLYERRGGHQVLQLEIEDSL